MVLTCLNPMRFRWSLTVCGPGTTLIREVNWFSSGTGKEFTARCPVLTRQQGICHELLQGIFPLLREKNRG
jgi:hypothetical protein